MLSFHYHCSRFSLELRADRSYSKRPYLTSWPNDEEETRTHSTPGQGSPGVSWDSSWILTPPQKQTSKSINFNYKSNAINKNVLWPMRLSFIQKIFRCPLFYMLEWKSTQIQYPPFRSSYTFHLIPGMSVSHKSKLLNKNLNLQNNCFHLNNTPTHNRHIKKFCFPFFFH